MTNRDNQSNGEGEFESSRDELDLIGGDFSKFTRQRLIMWGIRWIIGFAIIWAVVSFQPNWSWLWWVGGAVALVSLALLLSGQWLVTRKIKKADATIKRLSAEVEKSSQE